MTTISSFCKTLSPLLQLVGTALLIFKISLPLILIVIATFDLAKAVISSKNEDTKKYIKQLFKKLAIVVGIYFVPLLISILFKFIPSYNETIKNSGIDYDICYKCIQHPNAPECQGN